MLMLPLAPALARGQTMTVAWDPSPAVENVTGYDVCLGTSSLSCNVRLAPLAGTVTSYAFSPTPGVLHYVAIRARNAAGAGPFSPELRFSIPSFAQPDNQTSVAGAAITPVNLSIVDPDGGPLTITHTGLPAGLSIGSATRQITGTPSVAGIYNVTVFANDGLATASRSFVWAVIFDQSFIPAWFGSGRSADFDGDGRADVWAYQKNNEAWTWFVRESGNPTRTSHQWGLDADVPMPGDYDGDGRTDFVVYRPSTGIWYIEQSSTGNSSWVSYYWGMAGDLPIPADYDGDGRTDIAVYRPSTGAWYILQSKTDNSNWVWSWWGMPGDVPVADDYDGDGRADIAVYRPSNGIWYIQQSSSNNSTWVSHYWGTDTDIAVPGDYDGDGRADVAVYRPANGVWFISHSSTNFNTWNWFQWGASTDIPLRGDYDGDGQNDVAVYRPSSGTWYFRMTSTGSSVSYRWGD